MHAPLVQPHRRYWRLNILQLTQETLLWNHHMIFWDQAAVRWNFKCFAKFRLEQGKPCLKALDYNLETSDHNDKFL